ncbi:MAG: radical SAM protein, partial [Nitrospirae bacterium]|nr:radical SAM protein [Nitrospirota bacterium]
EQEIKAISRLSDIEPAIKKYLAVSPLSKRHLSECPSGRLAADNKPLLKPVVKNEPVLANIEITTRCNLVCKYCARSIYKKEACDMPREMFSNILDMLPHAYRVTLVGLGEPLLHPHIIDIIADASSRGRRVGIVTNAMSLDMALSKELIRAGLKSIAFSVDGSNQETASFVRQGTDFHRVIDNIKTFTELSAFKKHISTAVFTAVSAKTFQHLEQLIDVVAQLGVKVLMLSDLNFRQNVNDSLCKNADDRVKLTVKNAITYAFLKKLPVLSVHGLEEFGLAKRYKNFLLLPPAQLYQRSATRTYCCSPWQTIPVDVHGIMTVCDCQPENIAGNLFARPFSEIWNGKTMVQYRRRMLSLNPPAICKICPRF